MSRRKWPRFSTHSSVMVRKQSATTVVLAKRYVELSKGFPDQKEQTEMAQILMLLAVWRRPC